MKKEYKDYRFTCNYRYLIKEDKLLIKMFIKELRIMMDGKGIKFRQSWIDGKFFDFKNMSEAGDAFSSMVRIKEKHKWASGIPAFIRGSEMVLFIK